MSNKIVDREVLKVFRERFQKAIEDGDIVAAKALVSKQLENVSDESGSYQDKPFLFQATGTDSNTTETPTAPVAKHLELRGNTVVFNQLVDTNTTEIIPTVGHKYLTMINGVKSIITPADDTPISVSGGTDNVFDLTRMFGVNKEPISVVQFNRLFPLPYYAYNAGELKSCQSNKLITIGYNQFENLNQFIRVVAGQTYRLMYWNGTALAALTSGSIEEYDGAQTLIQTTTYDNLSDLHTVDNSYPDNGDKGIKLSDETQWVKIVSSTDSNILFNLAWDGSRSDFATFVKHEYTLPNWSGKSVPVVYDSYYPNGTIIQRIKHCIYDGVNRGVGTSQSGISPGIFNVFGDYTVFYLYRDDMRDIKKAGNYYDYGRESKARCSIPLIQDPESAQLGIWLYYVATNLIILLSLPTTTAATVEQANTWLQNNNVELQAALAEPIITTGHQTFAENVEVDDFGTMQFATSETESASNPIIPQGNRFFYPADYALLIDDLNQYINGDVQVLAKKSDLSGKQDKLTYEIKTIQTTDWTALSSSTPYTYSATVSATATISTNTIIELVNDNPILFATYGFAIASVIGQNITIYSIGIPDTSVSLKIGIGG